MITRCFRSWDWEFDRGIGEVEVGQPLPAKHALAFYDWKSRLFRVELRNPVSPLGGSVEPNNDDSVDVTTYDYYCDCTGRILQKRSLGVADEVFLIVDLEYDDAAGLVKEIAWWPNDGTQKTRERMLSLSNANDK